MPLDIDEILGTGLNYTIARAFHHMDLAEQAIEEAQARHPESADTIWDAFIQLQPTAPIADKGDQLILAHCAELLNRVAVGLDMRLPTKAEMLGFLVDLTLINPPGPRIEYWHAKLFLNLCNDGWLTMTDSELIAQVQENITYSSHRTSKDKLDAFYGKLQRELSCERPKRERRDE